MTNEPNRPAEESDPKQKFQNAANEKMAAAPAIATERSLWKGGYSAKAMYGTWLISAVVTVAALIAMFAFGSQQAAVWPIGGAAIIIWWCLAIGVYLYRRVAVHYELTSQRFIHEKGILVRRTDRIEVIDIEDVSITQGIIQRMLGVGTVHLTSSDRSHPQLNLNGIDQVVAISNMIDDVRRDERRRRSLFVASV